MLRVSCEIPRREFVIRAEFEVRDGEIYALFGPSAAGKSSILSAIAGFGADARGTITVDGEAWLDTDHRPPVYVPPWRRRAGYVEQTPQLFPHLSVWDNLVYGIRSGRGDDLVEQLIDRFGLRSHLQAKPRQLSGGLKQRTALARALAARPRLLLLDEPLSALDWPTRRALQDLLLEVHRDFQVPVVLVTHQLSEAQRMANRIGIVDRGQLLQQGSVDEVVTRPLSPRVASLVGYTAFLAVNGKVFGVHPDRVAIGALPRLGPVVSGVVQRVAWMEGRRAIDLQLSDGARLENIALHPLDEAGVGDTVEVTLIDPPEFESVDETSATTAWLRRTVPT